MAKSVDDRGRGARLARRDEGAYCRYVTEEQRSQPGCVGREGDRLSHSRALSCAPVSNRTLRRSIGPELLERAAAVVEHVEALDDLGNDASANETRPLLRTLAEAALAFLLSIAEDLLLLSAVDHEFELLASLLNVPTRLREAGETELAVRVAKALKFCAPD